MTDPVRRLNTPLPDPRAAARQDGSAPPTHTARSRVAPPLALASSEIGDSDLGAPVLDGARRWFARTFGGGSHATPRSAGAPHPQLEQDLRPLPPPATPRGNLVENVHGAPVADPYRWLEKPRRPDLALYPGQERHIDAWSQAQNDRFLHAMERARPLTSFVQQRLKTLLGGPSAQWPDDSPRGPVQWQRGADEVWRLVQLAQEATKDRPAQPALTLVDDSELVRAAGLPSSAFVDQFRISPDGARIALAMAPYHGDDRRIILIKDLRTGVITDRLINVKWTGLHWLDPVRLVYSMVHMTPAELARNAPDAAHQQRLHTVGTSQVVDPPLFTDRFAPWVHAYVWQDQGFLIRRESLVGSGRARLLVAPYDANAIASNRVSFRAVLDDEGLESVVGVVGTPPRLLVQTKRQADGRLTTGRLAAIDLQHPERGLQPVVEPVAGRELESVTVCGDKLVLRYSEDLGHRLAIHALDGTLEREIDLAAAGLPAGTVGHMRYESYAKQVRFSWSSSLFKPRSYLLDLASGSVTEVGASRLPFDPSRFSTDLVHYRSKDGTVVPMFVVRAKRRYQKHGKNPTLIYGYGGFAVDTNDRKFIPTRFIPFLEAGGTLALPALRGGAELGDDWHVAGKRERKQNVFDDFIAAAETLIARGYTSPEHLAAAGASNGGLLMGAVLTQRPDLFKVVNPHAGVLDMLRFGVFSSGASWIDEYGHPGVPADAATLLSYSPYHRVRDGVYPSVLVTTGAFDSRVDPSHSFKFAAALQHHQKGSAPVFLYTNPDSGHWSNRDPQRESEVEALRLGFIMSELGMQPPG